MEKISLYYNTIIHLNFKQILYQFIHRGRKLIRRLFGVKHSFKHYRSGTEILLDRCIPKYESFKDGVFTFLNLSSEYTGRWENKEYGDLWSFNINYMEYLLQSSTTYDEGREWIFRFLATQQENGIGMSPYCISLRNVNWIKFISENYKAFDTEELKCIDRSLYSQYRILLGNMEYNLGGNHLLENLFSILWGAVYFSDEKMYAKCARELPKQLAEQTLSDGANYEQSPMYQSILLDRILDCCNLLNNNKRFEKQEELYEILEKTASIMLGWLNSISYNDNSLPLFNDSALHISPSLLQLQEYACRLGIKSRQMVSDASGYYVANTEHYELRMDMGGITASYIPGHSHADTFNFEMRVDNKPFIVDTGISTYQKGDRRLYERSTAAHNTVVVNNTDSSHVWSGFRCAERAKVTLLHKNEFSVAALHDGYSKFGVKHCRKFIWSNTLVEIIDTLGADMPAIAYLHFAPEIKLQLIDDKTVHTSCCNVYFENADKVLLQDCEIATEYNILHKTHLLCIHFCGMLKTVISCK